MEQRGLLRRSPIGGGVDISVTDRGRRAVETARPLLAASVRRHFVDFIPKELEQGFRELLCRLVDGRANDEPSEDS